jgi:acid phosphatase family membrane protein YuiD
MKDYRFWELLFNPPLISAGVAMASSQLFKAIRGLVSGRRVGPSSLADYGGFPSSHSAFIAACATAIGVTEGFRSSLFALAVVAAAIFIYDILRLRTTVAQSKDELDRLLATASLTRLEKPPQFGSHTIPEVLGGIAWGILCALAICLAWG